MAARSWLLRSIALGLSAGAFLSSSLVASAATTNWVGAAGTPGNRWASVANWASAVPTSADTATFGNVASGKYNITFTGAVSPAANGVVFSQTANAYDFSGGTLSLGSGGVTQNGSTAVTFNAISLASNQSWSGTGALNVGTVTTTGKNLNLQGLGGNVTITNYNAVGSGTLGVSGQNVVLGAGSGPATINVNSGTLNVGALTSGDTDVNVNGGVLVVDNTDNYKTLSNTGGLVDAGHPTDAVVTSGDINLSGGQVGVAVGEDGGSNSYFQSTGGTTTLGGDLLINFLPTDSTLFVNGDRWNLFSGATLTGNFSAVSFSPAPTGDYAGLTFTQNDTEWKTAPIANGTFLVFDSKNGDLIVVPEPSTIVFAGVGVAMAGWSAWKKRRMAKVLAKS